MSTTPSQRHPNRRKLDQTWVEQERYSTDFLDFQRSSYRADLQPFHVGDSSTSHASEAGAFPQDYHYAGAGMYETIYLPASMDSTGLHLRNGGDLTGCAKHNMCRSGEGVRVPTINPQQLINVPAVPRFSTQLPVQGFNGPTWPIQLFVSCSSADPSGMLSAISDLSHSPGTRT